MSDYSCRKFVHRLSLTLSIWSVIEWRKPFGFSTEWYIATENLAKSSALRKFVKEIS